jgi:hypothetical protein
MKTIEAFETIDGERFLTFYDALDHEILLQLQCFYINHYTNNFNEALEMAKQIYNNKKEILKILNKGQQYDLHILEKGSN